jgi:hypothetical protein
MTKTISKFGNSRGVMRESGETLLTPFRRKPSEKKATSVIKKTARDYKKTLRKLA